MTQLKNITLLNKDLDSLAATAISIVACIAGNINGCSYEPTNKESQKEIIVCAIILLNSLKISTFKDYLEYCKESTKNKVLIQNWYNNESIQENIANMKITDGRDDFCKEENNTDIEKFFSDFEGMYKKDGML